jgi:hypothetical protein
MVLLQTRRTRGILAAVAGLFMTLVATALRPVPILPEDSCSVASGTVTEVREGEAWDLMFRLEGDPHDYYVNRGLRRGLTLRGLRRSLAGEGVTFTYPPHWTPLDPLGSMRHVSKVECAGAVLFDETR